MPCRVAASTPVRLDPLDEHVRLPLASIVVAKEPTAQSEGLAARAVAVDELPVTLPVTLPVRLPMKVGAVTLLVKLGARSLYLVMLEGKALSAILPAVEIVLSLESAIEPARSALVIEPTRFNLE